MAPEISLKMKYTDGILPLECRGDAPIRAMREVFDKDVGQKPLSGGEI
jgi:hypothetical protein